jgi:hypothetical protein
VIAVAGCGRMQSTTAEPPEPRPTRTITIPYAELSTSDDPHRGAGPEVSATPGVALALELEEPNPSTQRWVLLYLPPFMSAESSTFLPTGDASDPRARSVFVMSSLRSGRDEAEFGLISLTGTAEPAAKVRVTITAESDDKKS